MPSTAVYTLAPLVQYLQETCTYVYDPIYQPKIVCVCKCSQHTVNKTPETFKDVELWRVGQFRRRRPVAPNHHHHSMKYDLRIFLFHFSFLFIILFCCRSLWFFAGALNGVPLQRASAAAAAAQEDCSVMEEPRSTCGAMRRCRTTPPLSTVRHSVCARVGGWLSCVSLKTFQGSRQEN